MAACLIACLIGHRGFEKRINNGFSVIVCGYPQAILLGDRPK